MECTIKTFWEACILNGHPVEVVVGAAVGCIAIIIVLAFLADVLNFNRTRR